jgi:hypothetical protein
MPNLINFPWGSLTTFGLTFSLGFILAAFLFFRQGRDEFTSDEEIVSFLINGFLGWFIGARLIFCLSNLSNFSSPCQFFLPWHYPGLSLTGGAFGIIIACYLWSRRHKIQIWKLADAVIIPLAVFFASFLLGQWLASQEIFYLAALGLILITTPLSIWSLKSYRSLTWYPSGKIGFSLLITNTIFFLGFSLLAFFLASGLYYLEAILGIILSLLALTALALRSENEFIQKIINSTKNG